MSSNLNPDDFDQIQKIIDRSHKPIVELMAANHKSVHDILMQHHYDLYGKDGKNGIKGENSKNTSFRKRTYAMLGGASLAAVSTFFAHLFGK